jgi:hypothetical protein
MNRILAKIGLSIVILTLGIDLFSQVDVEQNNFQRAQNTLTNIKQSSFELEGFEGRAIQKLEELAGYIEIISNKEYDLTFREHALSMAKKMFYGEDIKISNSDKNLSSLTQMDLNDYLNTILKTGYAKIVVEISNKEYLENLSQNKSDAYSGRIFFSQTNSYYNQKEIQNKTTEKKEVEIILIKTEKNFGKRSQNVWNVYLGNIKTVEIQGKSSK